MKKRIIGLCLSICLLLGMLPIGVLAADTQSGKCGANAAWSYDTNTKTLTISGTGAMEDYNHDFLGGDYKESPWDEYREEIESVIVGNGITKIGNDAFGSYYSAGACPNLNNVVIGSGVQQIGDCAFAGAEKLESIELQSVTSIGEMALAYTGLESIYIPASVETIMGDGTDFEWTSCFQGCINLQSITVASGNPKYRSADGVLFAENALLCYPAGKTDSSYVIPSGTAKIAGEAFRGNNNITAVSVPASVQKIGIYAFMDCNSLQKADLAEGITSVASTAFSYTAVNSLVLPSTVINYTSSWFYEGMSTTTQTLYFTGKTAPTFDTRGCTTNTIVCYPESATGWDTVQQQDDVKHCIENGWLEFRTGTPPTEPSEPTDELKLVSTSPANGATNVTEDDSLVLTFNQELSKNLNWTKGSIYIKHYDTDETALKIDSAKFYALGGTVSGNTLTVPDVFVGLRTGKYYVSVDADVITNASGKTFVGIKKGTLSFAVVFSPYDTNWVWGKDNYRFLNNPSVFGSTYYIKDSDLNDFLSALDNTEIKEVASSWAIGESEQEQVRNLIANHLIDWSGSCYGMALTAAIFKAGILEPDNYGGDTTHDIKMNTDIRSFINIFQISQNVGAAMRYSLETVNKGQIEETLASMWKRACNIGTSEKQSEPFLVRLGYQSSDESWGHEVICYGAQEGTFSYTKEIDKLVSKEYSFSKRLLIADPNKKEETYIYISDDNRFAIYSAYPEVNAFGQREATLDELRNVTHWDVDVTTIILNIDSSDKVRVTANGGNAVVQKGHILSTDGLDISVNLRDIRAGNSAGSSAYSYILRGDADRVTLSSVDGNKLNADIQIGNYSVSVDGTLDSFTAGKNGTVDIDNAEDDIQLDLAINDADFDFVSISGKADGDTTLSVTSNAVTVSGEIADMEFTNMNRQTETSTAVVHGDLDAKFTLKNDTVVAAVDKDRDGTFETTLDSDTAQHQFKYVINANGTHTARCTLCEKTITEKHVFVNGVCVCGARKTSGSIDDSFHGSTRPITNNCISFTDVSKTDYFYDAVLWAVENGITTGTSRTRFSPYATCTRRPSQTLCKPPMWCRIEAPDWR